jgi:hypothetical protein
MRATTIDEAASMLSSTETCTPCSLTASAAALAASQPRRSPERAQRLASAPAKRQAFAPAATDAASAANKPVDITQTPKAAARWAGPIGIEGQMTGDGRLIQLEALRWDALPIPLRYVSADVGAHQGAVVVGRINTIERLSLDEANARLAKMNRPLIVGTGAENVVWGGGDFDLGGRYGKEAARVVGDKFMNGVSMDLDDVAFEVRVAAEAAAMVVSGEGVQLSAPDEDGRVTVKDVAPDDEVMVTLGARVRAATIVAVPAFADAQITLTASAAVRGKRLSNQPGVLKAEHRDPTAYNWVEKVGGLPDYIKRIAKHLQEKGKDESQAIAIAVNVVKKMCATGDLNFPGKQEANAGSRAEACAAVADWEAKKAAAHAKGATVIELDADETTLSISDTETKEALVAAASDPASTDPDDGGTGPDANDEAWEGQLHVPKGNGRMAGLWIDMPGSVLDDLRESIQALESNTAPLPEEIGKAFDDVFNAADEAAANPVTDSKSISAIEAASKSLADIADQISKDKSDPPLPADLAGQVTKAAGALAAFAALDLSKLDPKVDIRPEGPETDEPGEAPFKADPTQATVPVQPADPTATMDSGSSDPGQVDLNTISPTDMTDEQVSAALADAADEQANLPADADPAMQDELSDWIDTLADEAQRRGLPLPDGLQVDDDDDDDAGANLPGNDEPDAAATDGDDNEPGDVPTDPSGLISQITDLLTTLDNTPNADPQAVSDLHDVVSANSGDPNALGQGVQSWLDDNGDAIPPDVAAALSDAADMLASGSFSATLVAAAPPVDPDLPPAKFFSNPGLKGITPLTVTEEGRVYGHLATWGTCHLSYVQKGKCVTPPKSRSGYAYFMTGSVMTAEGAEVAVGQITLDTGHAEQDLTAAASLAHYDNTGLAVADIAVGEDAYGIWFSGALRPGLRPSDVRTLRAAPLSGDWRRLGTGLEMVAALAVNVQGFPVPRPKGRVRAGSMTSLVAAGMIAPRKVSRKNIESGALSVDDLRYLKQLAARERAEEAEVKLATLDRAAELSRRLRAQQMATKVRSLQMAGATVDMSASTTTT